MVQLTRVLSTETVWGGAAKFRAVVDLVRQYTVEAIDMLPGLTRVSVNMECVPHQPHIGFQSSAEDVDHRQKVCVHCYYKKRSLQQLLWLRWVKLHETWKYVRTGTYKRKPSISFDVKCEDILAVTWKSQQRKNVVHSVSKCTSCTKRICVCFDWDPIVLRVNTNPQQTLSGSLGELSHTRVPAPGLHQLCQSTASPCTDNASCRNNVSETCHSQIPSPGIWTKPEPAPSVWAREGEPERRLGAHGGADGIN